MEQPPYSSSLSYSGTSHPNRQVLIPSPSDDEDIAIPSGMPASTKISDLPTVPPPSQYWRLKKLDATANVMDYWIRSSNEWDLDGIESDITVCLAQSANLGNS
jgi:hypothetical protein